MAWIVAKSKRIPLLQGNTNKIIWVSFYDNQMNYHCMMHNIYIMMIGIIRNKTANQL